MIFFALSQMDIDWGQILIWPAGFVLLCIGLGALRGAIASRSRSRRAATRRPPASLPAPFRLRNVRVIDGDTFARGERRIRIYGMDAPEAGQAAGAAATEALRSLVNGKTLHILPKDVDVYGRLVARVLVGGIDVGQAMVKAGHAIATTDFTRAYAKDQAHARKERKGQWKTGRVQNPKAWRDTNKQG